MPCRVEYFNERVLAEIEGWPVGILADHARLAELLVEFDSDLRMPHTRPLGDGLFELRPRGREGTGRALYCYLTGRRVSCSTPSSRRPRSRRSATSRSPADG